LIKYIHGVHLKIIFRQIYTGCPGKNDIGVHLKMIFRQIYTGCPDKNGILFIIQQLKSHAEIDF